MNTVDRDWGVQIFWCNEFDCCFLMWSMQVFIEATRSLLFDCHPHRCTSSNSKCSAEEAFVSWQFKNVVAMLSGHYHERSFKGTDRKINDPAYSITHTHTQATKTTLCLEPTCLPLQQLLRCQSDSHPDKYVFSVLSLQRNWSNTCFFYIMLFTAVLRGGDWKQIVYNH